jgi:hypothetical protein
MTEYTNEQRTRIVQNMGLTVESVFVPFSQSRNAKEKSPSLNWRITVKRDGREVLITDYSAGCGFCPSSKASVKALGNKNSLMRSEAIAWECEHGYPAWSGSTGIMRASKDPLLPDTLDVLSSLAMEADVLDMRGFEDWASNYGYDTDSRKAEQTYRACLDIAVKLRAALGDSGLQDLRNAFQGY